MNTVSMTDRSPKYRQEIQQVSPCSPLPQTVWIVFLVYAWSYPIACFCARGHPV